MYQEPVTFIVPAGMTNMRKRVARQFKRLEKQVVTGRRVTWKVLDTFFNSTFRDWKIQNSAVDQHTGGKEFIERWWHAYFVPRFNALERAKLAQGRRLAGHGR